ncbi:MAG: acetyl-CoA decarbonylase/synthase complex subunit gamma [Candidatus Omnitrophota bacterium]|nr:acetyl-CoA decarbonylase/synthase complex subunit gamma [Candidatus Omnitrophota bacterium]
MALTGLDIYKLLPKTNCKDCGFATCLAFAMALAQKKVPLDKCPHVTTESKIVLESASQPPIKLVTVGVGDKKLEMGNETVMYRHEQKFYHPAGIGLLIDDTLAENEISEKMALINSLTFERVGQVIAPDLVCLKNRSGDKEAFISLVSKAALATKLNIALNSQNIEALAEALKIIRGRRPLIIWDGAGLDEVIKLANENKVPLAVTSGSAEEAAEITEKAKRSGVEEIVIAFKGKSAADTIQDFTSIRRTALKNSVRSLGYPLLAFTSSTEPYAELAEAVSYVLKYASLVIVKNIDKDFILPLLVARQDIYSDPQKPVQVESKVYEIGKVGKSSPVIVTTNFSITYFTVAGEVEASKVPTYIVCCDAEGMSVLTAWAAEKFTPESIDETIKKLGVEKLVTHKRLVIPGYVSVMSGKLEEITGWSISVGPREASGIPSYLRSLKIH